MNEANAQEEEAEMHRQKSLVARGNLTRTMLEVDGLQSTIEVEIQRFRDVVMSMPDEVLDALDSSLLDDGEDSDREEVKEEGLLYDGVEVERNVE